MIRAFHRQLDDREPLKLLLATLVIPILATAAAHGPAALGVPCGALVGLFLVTRAWCVYAPGR